MEFERTRRIIGDKGMDRLRKATVMVLGIGGVGGQCAEALARCGIGHLILVDGDKVSETNINRQVIALHSTVGRLKTEVMKERISDICPEIRVTGYAVFVLEENLSEIMEIRPDYIVDAIDTVSAKLALAEYCQREEIPLISSMGTGNKLNPSRFEISDISETSICPLCRVMRQECRNRGNPETEGAVFPGGTQNSRGEPGGCRRKAERARKHIFCAASSRAFTGRGSCAGIERSYVN